MDGGASRPARASQTYSRVKTEVLGKWEQAEWDKVKEFVSEILQNAEQDRKSGACAVGGGAQGTCGIGMLCRTEQSRQWHRSLVSA